MRWAPWLDLKMSGRCIQSAVGGSGWSLDEKLLHRILVAYPICRNGSAVLVLLCEPSNSIVTLSDT